MYFKSAEELDNYDSGITYQEILEDVLACTEFESAGEKEIILMEGQMMINGLEDGEAGEAQKAGFFAKVKDYAKKMIEYIKGILNKVWNFIKSIPTRISNLVKKIMIKWNSIGHKKQIEDLLAHKTVLDEEKIKAWSEKNKFKFFNDGINGKIEEFQKWGLEYAEYTTKKAEEVTTLIHKANRDLGTAKEVADKVSAILEEFKKNKPFNDFITTVKRLKSEEAKPFVGDINVEVLKYLYAFYASNGLLEFSNKVTKRFYNIVNEISKTVKDIEKFVNSVGSVVVSKEDQGAATALLQMLKSAISVLLAKPTAELESYILDFALEGARVLNGILKCTKTNEQG